MKRSAVNIFTTLVASLVLSNFAPVLLQAEELPGGTETPGGEVEEFRSGANHKFWGDSYAPILLGHEPGETEFVCVVVPRPKNRSVVCEIDARYSLSRELWRTGGEFNPDLEEAVVSLYFDEAWDDFLPPGGESIVGHATACHLKTLAPEAWLNGCSTSNRDVVTVAPAGGGLLPEVNLCMGITAAEKDDSVVGTASIVADCSAQDSGNGQGNLWMDNR